MSKRFLVFILIIILSLTGCSTMGVGLQPGVEVNPAEVPVVQSTIPAEHNLTMFAAASLTEALEEIGKGFENANPGVKMHFSFAGSQILRMQIEQGASTDIFASADHANMDLLVADSLLVSNSYQDFITNKMVIILPPGNPADVQTLNDLGNPHLKLILADPSVPAGNYARQVLVKMSEDSIFGSDFSRRVLANVVSNETDVKQVVTKVELGEADAGIAYVSDAMAAQDLVTITIPEQYNIIARYPIAMLNNSHELKVAKSFIAYILSPAGQEVLSRWGFGTVNR